MLRYGMALQWDANAYFNTGHNPHMRVHIVLNCLMYLGRCARCFAQELIGR